MPPGQAQRLTGFAGKTRRFRRCRKRGIIRRVTFKHWQNQRAISTARLVAAQRFSASFRDQFYHGHKATRLQPS